MANLRLMRPLVSVRPLMPMLDHGSRVTAVVGGVTNQSAATSCSASNSSMVLVSRIGNGYSDC